MGILIVRKALTKHGRLILTTVFITIATNLELIKKPKKVYKKDGLSQFSHIKRG